MGHDLFAMERSTWDRWCEEPSDGASDEASEPVAWSPAEIERAERLASALLQLNPRFERFIWDHAALADLDGITQDQARDRYRHVELDHADGDNAIIIEVHRDFASLAIPYWYSGASARATFLEAFGYLRLIERQEGWVSVDPYHGVIDLDHDLEAVVAVYEGYTGVADRIRRGDP